MIRTLLLLAACGTMLSACGGPTGNSPEAVCDRESQDDPAVKLIINRQGGNPWLSFADPDALKNARDRAKLACLARLGQRPAGGGVETVRPLDASYRGLF